MRINYGNRHADPRALRLSGSPPTPPACLNCSLSSGPLLSNDRAPAAMLSQNLHCLFNFAAVSCHMATGTSHSLPPSNPPPNNPFQAAFNTDIVPKGHGVRLMAKSLLKRGEKKGRKSDNVTTFSSAGPFF